ncbi:hypothetical protein [Cohnella sp. 56]|uniref:hypothetical protein n=1 Tax=Cohnella sp. 56 TaxID=3113722 RepID=UPI0030EAD821
MDGRTTDNELLHNPLQDPLLAQLRQRPFAAGRMPSERQLAFIAAGAHEARRHIARKRRIRFAWTGAVLALVMLLIGLAYAYEAPGGIADRHQAHAMGLTGTIRIPLGRTPEEAVEKFRNFGYMRVVHREAVDGGMLLFVKRDLKQDSTDLQIEFVRHTWLGWKWGMGGGYYIGHSTPGSTVSGEKTLLNYMSLPHFPGIRGPFPLLFGELTDPSVASVVVRVGGGSPGKLEATLVEYEPGQKLWFVLLPDSSAVQYTIQALDREGRLAAEKSFSDQRDMGEVKIKESSP